MKVTIDEDACASCVLCVDVCPEVFDTNDEGIAIVKTNPVPPESEESCRDAADQCPTGAILIDES